MTEKRIRLWWTRELNGVRVIDARRHDAPRGDNRVVEALSCGRRVDADRVASAETSGCAAARGWRVVFVVMILAATCTNITDATGCWIRPGSGLRARDLLTTTFEHLIGGG